MSEFAVNPVPPENHEDLLVGGLIVLLQFHKENAMILHFDQLEAHEKARQPLRAVNYVTESSEANGHIPSRHRRVVFGPQYNEEIRHNVAKIVARYPDSLEDFYPDNSLGLPWNDVFLEVWDTNGNAQDYLLNGKGLTPFGDAQRDVISDENCFVTNDLFTAQREPFALDLLSLDQLNDLLRMDTLDYESYVYLPHSNSDEQPYVA